MVDGLQNPYRTDGVADALFVGRKALLDELCAAVRSERNAIRAVMGGRGMGKSSLARQLEVRLQKDALTLVTTGSATQVSLDIGRALGVDLVAGGSVEALVTAVKRHPLGRVALVLDEVEKVLKSSNGDAFLDSLRRAYEETRGKLALIVLGGAAVHDLLVNEASPFLRIAGGIHTLCGLEREEAAELIRVPLSLDVPDSVVDALWAETAGHPWLLQMFMAQAVDDVSSLADVVAHIPASIRRAESTILRRIAFPIWWDNLRERGQRVYREVVRQVSAVPRARWVVCFGNDPQPWLDVLASTGVALLDEDEVIARGTLFQRWVEQNHPESPPAATPSTDALDAWLTTVGVDPFERLVVRALATWARATAEFPAAALKQDAHTTTDNSGLHPEAFFQMHAIVALLQHERDVTAEPEALSMRSAGRSDIKVRSRHDPARRACVEFKIFGRKDNEVVRQVIGYAAQNDTFAAVVTVDRCKRPLRPAFEARCFDGALHDTKHDAPATVIYPAFCTEHARDGWGPLRVWHFLVQLRDA